MDSESARTGTETFGNRDEPQCKEVHPEAGTAHRRSVGRTLNPRLIVKLRIYGAGLITRSLFTRRVAPVYDVIHESRIAGSTQMLELHLLNMYRHQSFLIVTFHDDTEIGLVIKI